MISLFDFTGKISIKACYRLFRREKGPGVVNREK
jgi:hypothetical protein